MVPTNWEATSPRDDTDPVENSTAENRTWVIQPIVRRLKEWATPTPFS
jgi:hypothetical protein